MYIGVLYSDIKKTTDPRTTHRSTARDCNLTWIQSTNKTFCVRACRDWSVDTGIVNTVSQLTLNRASNRQSHNTESWSTSTTITMKLFVLTSAACILLSAVPSVFSNEVSCLTWNYIVFYHS